MFSDITQDSTRVFRNLADDDVAEVVESQLATSSLALPATAERTPGLWSFDSTEDFWRAALSEKLRGRRAVRLHNVLLSEWFPRSPGLWHTEGAAWARREAEARQMRLSPAEEAIYRRSNPSDPVVHDLYGKEAMLRGGIGCIRLKERETAEGRLFFMSASTSLNAHEGVPLALTSDTYDRYIDEVAENGVLPCTLTGTLMFMPDSMLSLYQDVVGVPHLYLLVSELVPRRNNAVIGHGLPTASVAVMFRVDDPEFPFHAAYISFVAGRNGTLAQRLPWLDHYIGAMHSGIVITDFDEQTTRFPQAVFSLEKVTTGTLQETEIRAVADDLHIADRQIRKLVARQQNYVVAINVERADIHMGDTFSNIGAGAVIVNRSALANALNRVNDDYGTATAQALKELAAAITRAGGPDAIENFNGLSEELEKAQPSKHRLKTWLNAITSALPDVADVVTAVAKLAHLVL